MMLSILIPSRNEEYLSRTIEDILSNTGPETEIIVGLDGQWAMPQIVDNPRVIIVHYSESIGQRAMTNQLCRLSKAKYVMKVDAHCAFDKDFDKKMIADMHDDWTMAPTMRNLHVFNWVCDKCGNTWYQGPTPTFCHNPNSNEQNMECTNTVSFHREIVWNPKPNPSSTSYCFDPEPHFQYFNELKSRQSYKDGVDGDKELNESMSLQGSCFMLTRDKYWELNICDEEFGSWGSQGIEVACKTWLSGGRVVVSHKTWYAHLFRTQGLDFGFPYPISGKQTEGAKKIAGNKLYENNWPRQILPSSWLIDRFWPVTRWSDTDRTKIAEAGISFINQRFEELRVLGIIPSIPSTVTNHTTPVSIDGRGEKMAIVASGLSKLFRSSSIALKNVLSVRNELEVGRITAESVVTNVVKNGNIFSLATGDVADKDRINQTVNSIPNFIDTDTTIPASSSSSPNPTLTNGVNSNLSKDSSKGLVSDFHNTSIPSRGCIYYTDNLPPENVFKACQKQIWKAAMRDHGLPVVSCSLKPLNFGKNIVYEAERGYITMTKQILMALEALDTDIVYFLEHDVLYHPSHFDFTPPDRNTWYYDANYWFLRLTDGFAISYDCSPLSGLVVYRDIAIKHFKERLALMEKDQFKDFSMYHIGFEPMTHGRIKWENSYPFKTFISKTPSIDISHGANVTKKRWSIDEFRRKPTRWMEGNIDTIDGWNNVRRLLA